MTIALRTSDDLNQTKSIQPATENSAIAFCCQAYSCAFKATRARGKGNVFASLAAAEAYRSAMPPLIGQQNIRDFIACTAHAMLINAIDGSDAARLLYAAQIAFTTVREPSARQNPAA